MLIPGTNVAISSAPAVAIAGITPIRIPRYQAGRAPTIRAGSICPNPSIGASQRGETGPATRVTGLLEALATREIARLAKRAIVRAAGRQCEQREDLVCGPLGDGLACGLRSGGERSSI